MITFCSKCGINWAQLHNQQQGDEVYEYCPKCKTDMFLQPGNDIVTYTCCPFSGEIRNTETRELYTSKSFIMAPPVKNIVFDETLEEFLQRKQQLEDTTPLNMPVPKIERKHHHEFI